jgi:diadenosine tetraphosphate (Ap4A) HIT family hydrolase
MVRVAGRVFCDIVAGIVPAFIVHKDSDSRAFLDRAALMAGYVVLVPPVHLETLDAYEYGLESLTAGLWSMAPSS